jgi:type VI secretion system secreted protein VgrG
MPRTQAHRSMAVGSPLGDDKLLLKTMTVSEQLGRPFTIDLDLLSEDAAIKATDVLGQRMSVRVELPNGGTRYFNGHVSRWVQESAEGALSQYRAVLSPWLWFLTRTANCRIFQEMTVPDIIKQVFRDHGFSDFEDKLGSYGEWEYCVQYRETDFNFISRLMEQEGIYYYFTHEEKKHKLVLVDSSSSHVVNEGYDEIAYHQPDRVIVDREFITALSVESRVQSGAYVHTDYDFIKPKTNLETKSQATTSYAGSNLEVFDFPGEFGTADDGNRYATVRLEEIQTDFEVAHAETDSRGVLTGCKFKLAGYPRTDWNKDWVVISTMIRAESDLFESGGNAADDEGGTFSCTFAAIDAATQFRPARITPKPTIAGPQTAVVCGKSGEEIWTDEHGRVKVMFHWDRECKADEHSSCWIRVAQPWAGKKWGAINLPRIGQEVIVEFLEGDPDLPIITGRVYNGVNQPPGDLPDSATQTTFKTNSSKGGAGFNELRFEDKKGEEQVFIYAEKDMHLRVKNDRLEIILNNSHSIVKKDEHHNIDQDLHSIVKRDQSEDIGGDHSLTVAGDQALRVDKSYSLKVKEDVAEEFTANHSEKVTKDFYLKAKNIVIEAETNITIKVGGSFIAIQEDGIKIGTDGEVVVDAKKDITQKTLKNFTLEATMNFGAKGTAGLKVESPATTDVAGATTTVKGDGMLTLKGGMVMIN